MKFIAITASVLLSGMVLADSAQAGSSCYTGPVGREHANNVTACGPVRKQPIHIDCFRGPWRETIWDHPQGSFVNDLVKFGYDYGDAMGIATDICKNVDLVGDAEGLRRALIQAIAADPPGSK
ncbi:hypothetical protein [Thioclava pacifica]|uniref:Uncharacterized protein n=1 Tax=Thioclava pacifica DSM 10166 TaxID=1353537 RepID=A0A074J5Z3_9RHOB|nr:hypothetical protein [Thioclava pacifica]KEO52906.1 hypothetical protein TP2_08170 [Thioclava pacifica DSM 10166]